MRFGTVLKLMGSSVGGRYSRVLLLSAHGLRFLSLLFSSAAIILGLGAGQARAWVNDIDPPNQTQAAATCPDENSDSWIAGSTAINPGAWANFNRNGTGWQFIYNDLRTQMKAVFFTYSAQGKPTWLATRMVAFQSDGTWKAPFYKYSATAAPVIKGSVGIYFFPNDATRVALRWSWDQLAVNNDPDQLECLHDFNRGGPDDFGGGSTNSTPTNDSSTGPSVPTKGPNTIFSGFWNATGAVDDVPGMMVAIHQNIDGVEPARFTEADTLTTFDAAGEPVWLTAQKPIDPINGDPFTLPPWGDLSMETAIVIPNKTIYPHGVPINDCPMWQPPPPATQILCVAYAKVGDYVRSYTRTATNVGGWTGTARFGFLATPPGPRAAPFNWPNTPQPLAGAYFWPGTAAQTINKITNSDGIIVNRLAYLVGNGSNHYDEFWVSWNLQNASLPSATTAWRHDLNTGAYTRIGNATNGLNGYVRDPLPQGSRVQYELWTGDPTTAGSQRLYQTPEARVFGVAHRWDAGDGQAAIPPPRQAFAAPSLDAGSDTVGAVAGQFHVDEMGHAGYQIPLVVPAGRGGVTPQLALSYNSAGGDGYLGTGMSLSGVSSISACRPGAEFAGDGLQFSATPSEFCLDGQRLLLVSGTHRQLNATYKLEIDDMTLVVITGSDTLPMGGGLEALQFTAYGKDGSVRRFGGAAGATSTRKSTIEPNAFNVIAWNQTSLADAVGNTITYAYSPYNVLGERYLTSVSYTGGQISFNYDGPSRTDVSYSTIGPAQRSTLMRSITINSASGAALRYYTWTYGTTALDSGNANYARYRITDIKECSSSAQTVCYPATTFLWKDQGLAAQTSTGNFNSPEVRSLKTGDFNGDGRMDLVWTNGVNNGQPQQLHVAYSKRATVLLGFSDQITLPVGLPDAYNDGAMWEVLDVNGDGRDDIIFAYRDESTKTLIWYQLLAQDCGQNSACFQPVSVLTTMPDQYVSGSILVPPPAGKSASLPSNPESVSVLKDPGSSLVADVNGDGLADLMVRASDGQMWVVIRQSSSQFLAPMKAEFFDADGVTGCTNFIQDLDRNAEGHSQATDADGDGRADFRAIIKGAGGSFNCTGAQVDASPSPSGSNIPFHQETFVSRGVSNTRQGAVFRFQRYPFFNDVSVLADDHASANAGFRSVDINGDGLVDLVYLNADHNWAYQLNGGWTAGCIGGCQLHDNARDVQLIDFDGDGKLDFWFPNSSGNYDIHTWKGSSFSGSPVSSQFPVGGSSSFHMPADFDGDGQVDSFSLNVNGDTWQAGRSSLHHQPRGVVWEIKDGFNAITDITYAPLTYSSVYRRDFNGPNLLSGQLSQVFDITGPSYVVSYVKSSAPTYSNAADQAIVRYRYAGMKVQAGGRGSLGFRRMSTIDMQTGVEVDTWFNQAFPLTGTPQKTLTRQLSGLPGDTCGNPDAQACMTYNVCAGGPGVECDDDLYQMTDTSVLKRALDQWDTRNVESVVPKGGASSSVSTPQKSGVVPGPVLLSGPAILVKTESTTQNYDPTHGFSYPNNPTHWDSTSMPVGGYDAYGNPTNSTVVQSGGGTTITTESVFDYQNTVAYNPGNIVWRLGRLQSSRVKISRSPSEGAAISLRQSNFTYESHGLLDSERVDGMTGTFPGGMSVATSGVTSYYGYDAYGNRTSTRTCSSSLGVNACKNATAATSQFHAAAGSTNLIRYSLTAYDSLARFPDSTTEVFSNGDDLAREVQVSSVSQRNEGGDPLEMSSVNGVSSKIRYGTLGRKRFAYASTGASSRSDWATCNASTCPTNLGLALSYVMTTTTTGAPTTKTFYDLIGRPAISMQNGFGSGQWISTITFYDARGNTAKQSTPFFAQNSGSKAATAVAGSSILWADTQYDSLNRPISASAPGAGTTTIAYSGLLKTTTLPANKDGQVQSVKELRNGAGEVISTEDAYGLVTSFSFDAAGNQTRLSQNGRNIDMQYDGLGRKISMTDPDMGAWTYVVNDAGETIRQISARGTCTESRYDGRGRVWQRLDYTSSSGNSCSGSIEAQANWLFDTASSGIGALAEENSSINGVLRIKRTMAYDSLGRASSVTSLLDGKTYLESSTYDQYGRAYQGFFSTSGVNQTGELVEYNDQGYQYRVRSAFTPSPYSPSLNMGVIYNEVASMNARGQVVDEYRMAGANVETTREYDPSTGRLKRILTGGGYLQDLSYDYDNLGNVKYREDRTDLSSALREDFTYDKLQRLLSSTVKRNGVVQSNQDLSFWSDGNISTKTGVGTYSYGTKPTQCNAVSGSVTPGPHAVSSTVNGASSTSYCYDANGNLLRTFSGATGDKTLTWTAYDQAATMSSTLNNAKVGFEYGPNRERIRRLDFASALATSAESLTHFVGSAEVRWSANGTSAGALQEIRRNLGGVIIVQRGTGSSQTIKREYLLTDAQGSTYAVLDDYGMPINASARMSFDPFGKRRAVTNWTTPTPWSTTLGSELKDTTRHGYTGHEQVDAVGIIHMGGRIYDPNLGRFLQADPFIQAPGNSQSLNRYTYVFNNPMAFTDPTGYWGAREQAGLRTVVAIVIAAYTGYYAGSGLSAGTLSASQAGAISFAGGFAAGAVQSGNLRGAVIGGISSLAFFGVARAFPVKGMNIGTGEGMAAYSKLALASGITGGIMAEVQGGRFGNGFISAGASAFLSPIPEAATSNPAGQSVIAAVIGGTVSQATGGKFANGAITGAFQFAMGRALLKVNDGDGSDPGDPELADLVTNRVNQALGSYGVLGKKFGTQEELAIAWATIVDPIANSMNDAQGVEVGSLIYELDGKYSIAGAWSKGSRNNASELFEKGARVPGGKLSGFIHNHPRNISFSHPSSTYYTDGGYILPSGDIRSAFYLGINAYVSMPNGQIDRWSYTAMQGLIRGSIAAQIPAYGAPVVTAIRNSR